jgi:hypothetical protein
MASIVDGLRVRGRNPRSCRVNWRVSDNLYRGMNMFMQNEVTAMRPYLDNLALVASAAKQ